MTLRLVRIWLPAAVVVLGIVLFVLDPSANTAMGSAAIIGAGLSIWLLNFLFRLGVKGDRERDSEAEARSASIATATGPTSRRRPIRHRNRPTGAPAAAGRHAVPSDVRRFPPSPPR